MITYAKYRLSSRGGGGWAGGSGREGAYVTHHTARTRVAHHAISTTTHNTIVVVAYLVVSSNSLHILCWVFLDSRHTRLHQICCTVLSLQAKWFDDTLRDNGASDAASAEEYSQRWQATYRRVVEYNERCGFPSCAAEGTKQCTVCKNMWYCGVKHQRGHWKTHKVECKAFAASGGGGAAGGAGAAAPEGKDAGEGGGGGDAGERTATEARYDTLGARTKEDGFDIHTMGCGPLNMSALAFALGEMGEPHDEKAVMLALGVPGLDVNATNDGGQSFLWVQCYQGRSRNVKLLLADPRVDPNLVDKALVHS